MLFAVKMLGIILIGVAVAVRRRSGRFKLRARLRFKAAQVYRRAACHFDAASISLARMKRKMLS